MENFALVDVVRDCGRVVAPQPYMTLSTTLSEGGIQFESGLFDRRGRLKNVCLVTCFVRIR